MEIDYSLIPSVYASSLENIAPGTTSVVSSSQAPGESWIDTLQRVLPALVTGYQQKQLLDVQIQRAKAGLPPLNVSEYAPGVQVGVDSSTQRLLMMGGALALGLAFILTRRR